MIETLAALALLVFVYYLGYRSGKLRLLEGEDEDEK